MKERESVERSRMVLVERQMENPPIQTLSILFMEREEPLLMEL